MQLDPIIRRAATEELNNEKRFYFHGSRPCIGVDRSNSRGNRIGVGVGPVGAGVTVGQSPNHERRTTVIKEREPRDETVVIRKF
jgi:hypothetical protein